VDLTFVALIYLEETAVQAGFDRLRANIMLLDSSGQCALYTVSKCVVGDDL
jgi:hypothetical protein